jgi:hypothetical protein
VRSFTDDAGNRWQVMIGKESWGTLVLLFSPESGSETRKSVLQSETMFDASAELDALTDEALRARLRDSDPWS